VGHQRGLAPSIKDTQIACLERVDGQRYSVHLTKLSMDRPADDRGEYDQGGDQLPNAEGGGHCTAQARDRGTRVGGCGGLRFLGSGPESKVDAEDSRGFHACRDNTSHRGGDKLGLSGATPPPTRLMKMGSGDAVDLFSIRHRPHATGRWSF